MSGSAFAYWATPEAPNHQLLLYETFGMQLNYSKDPYVMLKFMKEADARVIVQLPATAGPASNGPIKLVWAPNVESKLIFPYYCN